MYERILIALDASPTDDAIVEHIAQLAQVHHSLVILFRVAHAHTRDGMVHEMDESEDYLQKVAAKLESRGIQAETVIAHGEPAEEIIQEAERRNVDLIAMGTHGHKGVYDLVFGSVSDEVRHQVSIPVILIRSSRSS